VIGSEGHGLGLAIFPLGAAAVAAVFGVRLGRRFARRRRPYEAMWSVAMFMFAAASLAAFLGVARGWTAPAYRVYWLLGAVLNVPYLAQGELYLLLRGGRHVANAALALLLVVTAAASLIAATGSISAAELSKALPLGKDAWVTGLAYQLRWLSWIGYGALIAGTVWSVRSMRGRPELRDRAVGTLGIAGGATIVAIGSGVGAGFGVVPLFAVGLAAGIALMFWGFLRADRPALAGSRSAAAQ
jgi:hypothetical protein